MTTKQTQIEETQKKIDLIYGKLFPENNWTLELRDKLTLLVTQLQEQNITALQNQLDEKTEQIKQLWEIKPEQEGQKQQYIEILIHNELAKQIQDRDQQIAEL